MQTYRASRKVGTSRLFLASSARLAHPHSLTRTRSRAIVSAASSCVIWHTQHVTCARTLTRAPHACTTPWRPLLGSAREGARRRLPHACQGGQQATIPATRRGWDFTCKTNTLTPVAARCDSLRLGLSRQKPTTGRPLRPVATRCDPLRLVVDPQKRRTAATVHDIHVFATPTPFGHI